MKCVGIACLGEDVGDIVARANVLERKRRFNDGAMVDVRFCHADVSQFAEVSAASGDVNAALVVLEYGRTGKVLDTKVRDEKPAQIVVCSGCAICSNEFGFGCTVGYGTLFR